MEMKVKLDEGAFMPCQGHKGDAGYDLRTMIPFFVPSKGCATVDTGVHIEIPRGYYGKLESKSGLNVKGSIVSLGGVVDSGYTGSIKVKLYNMGDRDYCFGVGDKIVQIVFMPCLDVDFIETDSFEDTERGSDGFGSTGR